MPNSFPVILVISLISLYLFINKVNIHVINTESRPEEQKEAEKVEVGRRLVLGGVKTWKLGKKLEWKSAWICPL